MSGIGLVFTNRRAGRSGSSGAGGLVRFIKMSGTTCPNCKSLQEVAEEATEHSVEVNLMLQDCRRRYDALAEYCRMLEVENRTLRELKKGLIH